MSGIEKIRAYTQAILEETDRFNKTYENISGLDFKIAKQGIDLNLKANIAVAQLATAMKEDSSYSESDIKAQYRKANEYLKFYIKYNK